MSIKVSPFPQTSHLIPLSQAIEMTVKYRNDMESILDPEFRNKAVLPLSETFNREDFDRLLDQAGCEGIRFYYSMDDKSKLHMIIVGVNDRNEDILVDQNALIIETGVRCPQTCPPASPLNS